jgi:hypothetical protein
LAIKAHANVAIDEGGISLGVEGDEVDGGAGFSGGVVFAVDAVLEKVVEEFSTAARLFGAADAGGGECAADAVNGVVV